MGEILKEKRKVKNEKKYLRGRKGALPRGNAESPEGAFKSFSREKLSLFASVF